MAPTNSDQRERTRGVKQNGWLRGAAIAFVLGAAATAVAGAAVQVGVQPTTDVSDDMWRYPWESSGAFVAFSVFSATLHALVAVGLLAFGRSGVAGRSRGATSGVAIATAGTLLLVVGEVASIPIRDAELADTSAGVVGAVFGVASVLSAAGFLLVGRAMLRDGVWNDWRRFTPIVTGIWTTALVGLALTKALPGGVAIYGACLLAMAVALYTEVSPAPIGAELQPTSL
jgi:hypothetical protein